MAAPAADSYEVSLRHLGEQEYRKSVADISARRSRFAAHSNALDSRLFRPRPGTIRDFEVSAEIVARTGPIAEAYPLELEAWGRVRPARQPGLAVEMK